MTAMNATGPRLNPRTASPDRSIWRDLHEEGFRRHLVSLAERTNAIPMPPMILPLPAGEADERDHHLTLSHERNLADDLAYLASSEGAQSVTAVCIESSGTGLFVRVAGSETINLEEVGQILMSSHMSQKVDKLLSCIVRLHRQKLYGRLRSSKWQKPKYLSRTHKKSLAEDFDNLLHRVQHAYPKKNNPRGLKVVQKLGGLQKVLDDFESVASEGDIYDLKILVSSCYSFCRSPDVIDFADKLENSINKTQQISAALKTLRQIEKIGAYKRITQDLVSLATKYPLLFKEIRIDYLPPYQAIPTDIGYENWAKTTHVHAEIQLAVYYDAQVDREQIPRTIGTSKYLCYLCYLFLKNHKHWHPTSCHGRLYDQWTIPDLAEYNDALVQNYRHVIHEMNAEIVKVIENTPLQQGKRDAWRAEPMTSRQHLLHLESKEEAMEVFEPS